MRLAALRNPAIVFAVAAAVYFLPGGGDTANFVANLLFIAMTAGFVWLAARLYRDHRMTLFSLGDTNRALLYGAVGVVVFAMAARGKLLDTSAGTLVWLVLVGGAVYAVYVVWRRYREYG